MTSYGHSSKYSGEEGSKYFAWQNSFASIGAELNSAKFRSYVNSGDEVLDFGCGGGWLLKALNCSRRVGVEPNLAAHECCRSNGIEVHSSVDTVGLSVFDAIISHHCLEHVPYPIEALRALRETLKKNGKLILVVPIDDWRMQRAYSAPDINHHLHTWTPLLLANTIREAGYSVVDIRVLTNAWFPGWNRVYRRIPNWIFEIMCQVWSVLRRRRQILAVATRND
jgi:SAM-dependent methyltransferase